MKIQPRWISRSLFVLACAIMASGTATAEEPKTAGTEAMVLAGLQTRVILVVRRGSDLRRAPTVRADRRALSIEASVIERKRDQNGGSLDAGPRSRSGGSGRGMSVAL